MYLPRSILYSIAALFGIVSAAEAGPVEVNLSCDVLSHYIDRGEDVLDGLHVPLQPNAGFSFANTGLSVDLWGSFATIDRSGAESPDQLDLVTTYVRDIGETVTLTVGGQVCFVNHRHNASCEAFTGVDLATILNPSLVVYYDTEWLDADGTEESAFYAEGLVGHSIPLGERILNVSAGLGFGSNEAFTGFQDATMNVSTDIPIDSVTLTPIFGACYIIEDQVNQNNYEVFGGISITSGW